MYILVNGLISYAFPIDSGALYLAIVLNAHFFLREAISLSRLVGIILIAMAPSFWEEGYDKMERSELRRTCLSVTAFSN
jgi:hypothetical protein